MRSMGLWKKFADFEKGIKKDAPRRILFAYDR